MRVISIYYIECTTRSLHNTRRTLITSAVPFKMLLIYYLNRPSFFILQKVVFLYRYNQRKNHGLSEFRETHRQVYCGSIILLRRQSQVSCYTIMTESIAASSSSSSAAAAAAAAAEGVIRGREGDRQDFTGDCCEGDGAVNCHRDRTMKQRECEPQMITSGTMSYYHLSQYPSVQ